MLQRMEHACHRNGYLLSLLFVILFYAIDTPFLAVAQVPPVNIIDLLYNDKDHADEDIQLYKHGFNASLWSRGFTLAGRPVNMISLTPDLGDVSSEIEKIVGNSDELFIVLGPGTTDITISAFRALRTRNIVAFGPLSRNPAIRIWVDVFYFFLVNAAFSAFAALHHAVTKMRAVRIGVMYTTDAAFGYDEYFFLEKLMKDMDREFCGVFEVDVYDPDATNPGEINKKWEAFAESKPQVVIVLGLDNLGTKLFMEKILRDSRTRSTELMITYAEQMILKLWKTVVDDGTSTYEGTMFMVSTYPDPSSDDSTMCGEYGPIVEAYFQERFDKGYDSKKLEPGGWMDGCATLSGWVTGEILFHALSRFNPTLGRVDFLKSLFNQRSYIIGDFVVGPFGGAIDYRLEEAGAVAYSNQGGSIAHFRRFVGPEKYIYLPEDNYILPRDVRAQDTIKMHDTAGVVTLNITDVAEAREYMINEIKNGQEAGVIFNNPNPKHDMKLHIIPTLYDEAPGTFLEVYENFWTNIVTGIVAHEMLDLDNLTFIDVLSLSVKLNKVKRNVIYLTPIVEQQVFVFADYVSSMGSRTIHVIIRTKEAQEVLNMVEKTFAVFEVKVTSTLLERGHSVEKHLLNRGLTFLIEVDDEDIPVFLAHLEGHRRARVAILFAPFAGYYDKFCAAFNGTRAAERLLTITNLPHWADANSPSQLIHNYHKVFTDPSSRSPLSLQNFIVGRIMETVVGSLNTVTSTSINRHFYRNVIVNVDDMEFGPFTDLMSVTCTPSSDVNSLDCAQNFGATDISVWPISRVFDPTVSPLFGPVTPSMDYSPPSNRLSKAQLIGAIVGSILGAALLAGILTVLIKRFCSGNSHAPKKNEHPVTLIFTDIQSSTALWAACPQIMPDVIETHHRLIRRLIAKHRCYEVKTVGDSFMIACKNPYAAVHLVVDLQRTFLHHDWGTSAIDEAYRQFEENQARDDADYEPPTARLEAAVYRAHWCGVRVRAGVHTGLSDIRHDEVTKRYDYYGSPSNTAARTESIAHGGQVLLTRAAFMALSAAERAGLDVTSLGAVELRGVPEPVEMLQLNAVPGRTFAALRLERGNDDFDFDTSTLGGTETSGSQSEALTPGAENIFTVFQHSLSAFPPAQRLKILEPFCRQWRVAVPATKIQKDLMSATHLANQRLAMKVSRVVERRHTKYDVVTEASDILSSSEGSAL